MKEHARIDLEALLAGLPSPRDPHERLAAHRPRPYVLLALMFSLLLLLPELGIVSIREESFPRIQQLLEPKNIMSWRRDRMDESMISANLGMPLEDIYTTEQVLATAMRWVALHDMRMNGAPIMNIPFGRTTIQVKPHAPMALLIGPILSYVLFIRRRERLQAEVAQSEEQKNEQMRALNESKIDELTAANRKLSDMQLKVLSAQKLASIGRLSATLAHEIRNPLTVIQSASSVIRDDLPEDSAGAEAVELIHQEIARLNRIITDLLNFANPKPPRITPHALNDLIREWVDRITEEMSRRKVSIFFRPGEVPEALLDSDQFYQVFLNIVWNARDAVLEQGGGLIDVTTLLDASGMVAVEVRDNGPGMTPVVMQQITEPFYTTKTKGTGLGLSVVQQLMEGMGGRLRFESAPEEGTRVFLLIQPVAASGSPGPASQSDSERSLA